jgi:hypothetical protein
VCVHHRVLTARGCLRDRYALAGDDWVAGRARKWHGLQCGYRGGLAAVAAAKRLRPYRPSHPRWRCEAVAGRRGADCAKPGDVDLRVAERSGTPNDMVISTGKICAQVKHTGFLSSRLCSDDFYGMEVAAEPLIITHRHHHTPSSRTKFMPARRHAACAHETHPFHPRSSVTDKRQSRVGLLMALIAPVAARTHMSPTCTARRAVHPAPPLPAFPRSSMPAIHRT